jgi:hypothetical protein
MSWCPEGGANQSNIPREANVPSAELPLPWNSLAFQGSAEVAAWCEESHPNLLGTSAISRVKEAALQRAPSFFLLFLL